MYFTVIKEKKARISVKQEEFKELEAKLSKTIAVVKRKKEAARRRTQAKASREKSTQEKEKGIKTIWKKI